MSKLIFLLATLVKIHQTSSLLDEDHFWRDYTGIIPGDAFIAGTNVYGKNVYIGQAFITDESTSLVEIEDDVAEFTVAFNEDEYSVLKSYVKILCTAFPEKFFWYRTKAQDLHADVAGKQVVIGGREPRGIFFVGRVSMEGNTRVGRVDAFREKHPDIFVVNRGAALRLSSYEVLLYGQLNTSFVTLQDDGYVEMGEAVAVANDSD